MCVGVVFQVKSKGDAEVVFNFVSRSEDHPRCCRLASIEGVSVAVCPGVGRLQQ